MSPVIYRSLTQEKMSSIYNFFQNTNGKNELASWNFRGSVFLAESLRFQDRIYHVINHKSSSKLYFLQDAKEILEGLFSKQSADLILKAPATNLCMRKQ